MKSKKEMWSNGLWIVGILVLLFTPVGFHAKVYVNQMLSGNPKALQEEQQKVLTDYEWQLAGTDGAIKNFVSQKGKVTVVNLWATWCPPCVAEMPSFQKLYEDYGQKVDFVFLAEDDPEKVSSFLEKKGYTFPVFYGKTAIPEMLSSKSIPTTYVLDKQGKIVVKEVGAADWNSDKSRALLDGLLAN